MRSMTKLAFVVLIIGAMVLACAPAAPTAAPAATKAPAAPTAAPAATSAPAAAAKPTAAEPPAAAKAGEKPKRGGVVKFAVGSEMTPNLDPHQNTNHPWGYEAIYSSYIQYVYDAAAKKWELKPLMVDQWSTPDPKTIIFKLRKGVSFHDGSPWNATAAKWNLDRHRGVDFKKSSYKAELEPISSIDIVDDYTIKINLNTPSAAIIPMLSDGSYRGHLMSMESTKKNGDAWAETHMVGAGPMKFVDWKRDDRITATKWDKYWENGEDGQPLPYLEGMEIIQAKDLTAKALNMRVGQFDGSDNVAAKDQPMLGSDPNLTLVSIGSGSEFYFFVNMKDKVWGSNQKLRQAVGYALDRDSIAKAAGLGIGQPAYYHWAPGMLGYSDSIPKYTFDPNKSKQLLKEAGFENGAKVELSGQSDDSAVKMAQILKQMWDTVGIQTTIASYDRTAVQDKWLAAEYEIGVSSKTWGEVDADIVSWRFTTGGSKNFAATTSKAIDDCMKEGRETQDPGQRQKIYEKCQTTIFEEAAYGTLYTYPNVAVFSKKLKGYTNEMPMNAPRITRAWLDK